MRNQLKKKKSIKKVEEPEDNNKSSNENVIYTQEVKISIKNIKTINFTFPNEFPFSDKLNNIIWKLNKVFLTATSVKRETENVKIPNFLKKVLAICIILFIAFLIISIAMKSGHIKVYISFSILGLISILLIILTIVNYSYSEGNNEMYTDITTRLFKEEIKKINNDLENDTLCKGKIHFLFAQDEQVIKVRYYGKNTRRGGKSISLLDPMMIEHLNINGNENERNIEMSIIAPSENASTISLEKNNEKKELLKTEKKKKKKRKSKSKEKHEENENNKTSLKDDTQLNLNNTEKE